MNLLLPILIALSVVLYTVYNLSSISHRINLIEISDDINLDLLELRRYEKNIILFKEEENINRFYDYLDQIKRKINDIEDEITAEMNKLNYEFLTKELQAYKEVAQPLISSTRAEQTLVEDIRPLGRMLESGALHRETALELRRHEKNYIIYKEQTAVDKLHKIAEELMTKQPAMSGLVRNYLDAFDTLVKSELQKDISVEKMRQSGRAIESITMEFSNKQRSAIDGTIAASRKLLIGAFAFLMFSTCILVYLFSIHVVRTLKKIEHSFDRLRAGDYTFGIDIKSGRTAEELITFVDSYNQTITDLRASRNELELTLKKLADANRELIERQDELVEARKVTAMRLLASEIAHEINNPLSSLTTFLGIFHEDLPAQDTKKETLALMLKETERCRLVLRELVDFARKEPLQLREVSPKKLVSEAIEVVCRQHPEKGIRLTSSLNRLPEKITVDPILIHQALVNILNNAYQFTYPEGRIIITGYIDGNNMIIAVRDTGVGIAEKDLPRIFEPFFSTRKDIGGSGLGLALTKKIVESHNGLVRVESKLNEETVFKMELPVDRELI